MRDNNSLVDNMSREKNTGDDSVQGRLLTVLEEIKRRTGQTQRELANALDLGPSAISQMKRRTEGKPRKRTIEKLIGEYGVSQRWLLEGEGPVFSPEAEQQDAGVTEFHSRLELIIEKQFGGKWTRLARAAELSHGSVNNYLKGITNPGYKQLSRICDAAGINANWLLSGHGPMRRGAPPSEREIPQQEVGREKDWWQDLARTLQLRINDLERELARVREERRSPADEDRDFLAAWAALPEERRARIRRAVLAAEQGEEPREANLTERRK